MNILQVALKYAKAEEFTGLIFQDKRYSNRELTSHAKRFAHMLEKVGQTPGDMVATILPNCMEIMPIYEGIFRRGAIVLPVVYALTSEEIRYILTDSGAKFIITEQQLLDKVTRALQGIPQECKVVVIGGDASTGFLSYEKLLEESQEIEEIVERDGQDTAMVMYTSGTTGKPKGAMLSHDTFIAMIETPSYGVFFKERSVCILALPMNHAYGLQIMLIGYYKNETTLLLHEWFQTEAVLKDIEKYRVFIVPMVPTMLHMILAQEDLDTYDLSSIQFWMTGGAPISVDKLLEAQKRLPGITVQGYGLTETAGEGTCQMADAPVKPGSSGRPIDSGVEIKIVDVDGNKMPPGEWGEICMRGNRIMKGYLNKPRETAEAIKGGWLYTGDIGYVDEDGDLYITERIKEMIIRGGENIYPAEVEDALYRHPALSEVAVFGLPDSKYGEEVHACVVLRSDQAVSEEEILTECQKHIPRYKCPKKVTFFQELPKTQTGKIQRKEVREMVLELMGGDKP